jgi:HAD superfamily phosphatase (TIGR01681 family)
VHAIAKQCPDRPIFFMSFLQPKHNYLGSMLKRYSLSNPVYFVEQLNRAREEAFSGYANAYLIDMNELMALVGSVSLHDDYLSPIAHAAVIDNDAWDAERIQISTSPRALYDTMDVLPLFEEVVARRLLDNLQILRKPLEIKAIIVDFDDTIWRGIAAEELTKPHWEFTEGWPLGLAEALLIFKARGGMIAACSKNDEETIRKRWRALYGGRLRLEDFVSVKINFERKSDNVRQTLAEFNILPANILFIDDNPREIDEVRSAFPDMTFLSAQHYDWRRKILMSRPRSRRSTAMRRCARLRCRPTRPGRRRRRGGARRSGWPRST